MYICLNKEVGLKGIFVSLETSSWCQNKGTFSQEYFLHHLLDKNRGNNDVFQKWIFGYFFV